MGLTIHYRLRSAAPSPDQARQVVHQLRSRALDLPFESVEDIVELTGDDCNFHQLEQDHPHGWLLIQAQAHVSDPWEPARHYSIVPLHIVAFTCQPGPGCEPANVGLCRYPEVIELGGRNGQHHCRMETGLHDWSWASFCKTGHAQGRRHGGAANFRRCHLAVLDLLQYAQQIGILHAVHDEAGLWESRQAVAPMRAWTA